MGNQGPELDDGSMIGRPVAVLLRAWWVSCAQIDMAHMMYVNCKIFSTRELHPGYLPDAVAAQTVQVNKLSFHFPVGDCACKLQGGP